MKHFISAFFLALLPTDAWAFVPHNYPEIYIHQMGHVYFLLSCTFVIWAIFHNRLYKEKGWRCLLVTEVFLILWNLDTFAGHVAEFWIEPSQITGSREGWDYFTREIAVEGIEYIYYMTKFDNLLLAAAMLFFYKSLSVHLKEEEKVFIKSAAILPLLPIILIDIAGSALIVVLAVMSFIAALRLYKKNKENTLWNYMLWLSTSYVLFSLSRSTGHILHRFLTALGHEHLWEHFEPFSGSFNTFTFIIIGTVNLFFFKAYQSYLRITDDNRKIEAINADLTELNHELETLVAERTMSLMALTVADRIRNPAAVIGWTCRRMLEKEEVTGKLGDDLKDVISESEKLEGIVKDFETLLKSKQSMFKYEDINEILTGVLSIVVKEAADKKVALNVRLSEQPLRINIQRNLMRAAVFHVIRNAIEATKEGGDVEIVTFEENGKVVISISDTGAGIPPENIEKIFDPFFSTKKFRFGIGLPLVKQIVSEHLGEIKVDSRVGTGTTFKIIFPARWTERKTNSKSQT